ncbi:DUF4752 family protein, partial [Escherichia coli]
MTTITKERLLTIKQWRETYGPGSNVVLPAEEAEELARIALASLEAEPVVYMWDSERKDIDAPGYYRTEHLGKGWRWWNRKNKKALALDSFYEAFNLNSLQPGSVIVVTTQSGMTIQIHKPK